MAREGGRDICTGRCRLPEPAAAPVVRPLSSVVLCLLLAISALLAGCSMPLSSVETPQSKIENPCTRPDGTPAPIPAWTNPPVIWDSASNAPAGSLRARIDPVVVSNLVARFTAEEQDWLAAGRRDLAEMRSMLQPAPASVASQPQSALTLDDWAQIKADLDDAAEIAAKRVWLTPAK